jgi:hypothetical protein
VKRWQRQDGVPPFYAAAAASRRDEALQASIRAKGILQNVIVHSVDDDRCEIDAGGRRFRILQQPRLNPLGPYS